jgi:hypothetical protein
MMVMYLMKQIKEERTQDIQKTFINKPRASQWTNMMNHDSRERTHARALLLVLSRL